MQELTRQSAVTVVEALRVGKVSPLECLDALEARIRAVDTQVNALPTLCFDRAREHARRLMRRPPADRGLLAGLPVPIKDLADVQGVRSTQGSPIFADRIAETSDVLVTHVEGNGGVVYGMTNTPEFGAGANTFNEVFGRTLNPWNTARSAAGSSGGAAVALATGMAWVAHGSDMGGSLRNPASFCGVVGFRPSPGRVAATPGASIGNLLSVDGPLGRTVADTALLFDAMAGEEWVDPLSMPKGTASYLAAARSGKRPRRVAVSRDLGITPVEPEVADAVMRAARALESHGVIVEEAHPDFSEAHACFQTLRAVSFATWGRILMAEHRDKLKPEVIWNIEKGLNLTGEEIVKAEAQRAEMFRRTLAFFETYDLLLCPATITAAFPVEQRYLAQCNGHTFETYIDWLAIVYAITLVACPAISIPCGFTREDLPIGLQVVAPPHGDARLLAGAQFIEDVLGLGAITPIDPRPAR
ncbi:MAG: amidase family protein [Hyphomicrobiales bacterium]